MTICTGLAEPRPSRAFLVLIIQLRRCCIDGSCCVNDRCSIIDILGLRSDYTTKSSSIIDEVIRKEAIHRSMFYTKIGVVYQLVDFLRGKC